MIQTPNREDRSGGSAGNGPGSAPSGRRPYGRPRLTDYGSIPSRTFNTMVGMFSDGGPTGHMLMVLSV